MPDFATHAGTIWSGAIQAAATIVARHEEPNRYDADQTAHRILDLAARIIRKLPEFDTRIGASVAATVRNASDDTNSPHPRFK